MITLAQHNAPKGQALLPLDTLEAHAAGLIALSGCKQGAVTAALLRHDLHGAEAAACTYRDLFGAGNFYIELQHHLLPEDDRLTAAQVRLARRLNIPYVATNNVHYAERDGQRLQDILVCIREGPRSRRVRIACGPTTSTPLNPARRCWPCSPLTRRRSSGRRPSPNAAPSRCTSRSRRCQAIPPRTASRPALT
jgi:DNA polymerase III alpha subunit